MFVLFLSWDLKYTGLVMNLWAGALRSMGGPLGDLVKVKHTTRRLLCSMTFGSRSKNQSGWAKIPTSWILRDTINEWVVRILLECILLPIFGRLTTQWSVRLHCSFVSTLAALLTLQIGIVPHFLEQIAQNINWKSITDTSVGGRC